LASSFLPSFHFAVVSLLLLTVASIVLPNLKRARQHAREQEAIHILRSIYDAEEVFIANDADKDGIKDYGSLQELQETDLLKFESSDFRFELTHELDPDRGPRFKCKAIPLKKGTPSFVVDDSSAIAKE